MSHSDDASAYSDDLSKLRDDVSHHSDEIPTHRYGIPLLVDDACEVITTLFLPELLLAR